MHGHYKAEFMIKGGTQGKNQTPALDNIPSEYERQWCRQDSVFMNKSDSQWLEPGLTCLRYYYYQLMRKCAFLMII